VNSIGGVGGSAAMTVDPRAATGFSTAADAYERGRPPYPRAAVELLVHELALSPAGTILDLAAGTGKLTRQLLPFAERVVAVDPSERMLDVLRSQLPSVSASAGTADAIPLPGGSVDAVVVGEAFHWFGNAAACREIARVLKPRGGLALLWNRSIPAASGSSWQAAVEALSAPYREAAGPFPAERWQDAVAQSGRFDPLASAEVEHLDRTDADGVVALVASWSWIANLPDDERAALLARVRDVVAGEAELAIRYRTEIFWTRRAP
jgi:SAM-dependent methyltransferase